MEVQNTQSTFKDLPLPAEEFYMHCSNNIKISDKNYILLSKLQKNMMNGLIEEEDYEITHKSLENSLNSKLEKSRKKYILKNSNFNKESSNLHKLKLDAASCFI